MPSKNGINYTLNGHGKVVVLLHGFLETKEMWKPLRLHENYQTIAIDVPGHGASVLSEKKDGTIRFFAREIATFLTELGIHSYDIIGHSMGGYIALEMNLIDSNIGKTILLHSNFWEDDEAKKGDRTRVAKIARMNVKYFVREAIPSLYLEPKKHEEFIQESLSYAYQLDGENVAITALAMKDRIDFSDWVEKNKTRVFCIQGDEDKIVPLNTMLEKIGEGNLTVIPNCGHMGHIEASSDVRLVITDLLA